MSDESRLAKHNFERSQIPEHSKLVSEWKNGTATKSQLQLLGRFLQEDCDDLFNQYPTLFQIHGGIVNFVSMIVMRHNAPVIFPFGIGYSENSLSVIQDELKKSISPYKKF